MTSVALTATQLESREPLDQTIIGRHLHISFFLRRLCKNPLHLRFFLDVFVRILQKDSASYQVLILCSVPQVELSYANLEYV